MNYKILWTDMHSNIHHEDMDKLPQWFAHAQKTVDFWPIAYYPYTMRKDVSGLGVEDIYSDDKINKDWETLRTFVNQKNKEGFPMFMGYEWQGAGLDGDHNIFFKHNDALMAYPLRYQDLVQNYLNKEVIGIPHHLAYQLEHRGKNWSTHNAKFSPFVEIYSSHGSSENDNGCIDMTRHVHMGPRTGLTTVEQGWKQGHQFGVIAAGDNHSAPCVYGFGYTAILSKSNSKEDIWDAFINRRVYGVSQDRIELDYTIDGAPMGSIIPAQTHAKLKLHVIASNAIDRVEIIEDEFVREMIPHTSLWEKQPLSNLIKVKFKVDMGWGPDRRIFPEIESRVWNGSIVVEGKLLNIEKCWSNFGQDLYEIKDNGCSFTCTSYKTTASGKWMGPSAITTEGFIFEVEGLIDSNVTLTMDGQSYIYTLAQLMETSRIIPLLEEVEDLLKERFGFEEYYRSDPWWHNAYKIKLSQAVPEIAYTKTIEREINTKKCKSVRIKVYQKNGATAWSSPIFFKGE